MKVLVADDRPTTRFVLKKKLGEWGYDVIEAADGARAWQLLNEKDPPRIAILDWIMPEMDGVTICRKLKEREGVFIYTILLTSKSEKQDLIYALENGAHNFQSKPISPEELRSHVNVGKHLVEADDKLNEYATHMEHLAEERAKQLVHADRLATLGTLAAGITHEIGTPLTYILGHAKMMELHWNDMAPMLGEFAASQTADGLKYKEMLDSIPEKINAILQGSERISTIVKSMKTFSRKDTGMRILSDIRQCMDNALQLCNNIIKYNVTVEKSYSDEIPGVEINFQQIEQVFVNLIANASDSIEMVGKGVLKITAAAGERFVRIIVEDTGPGIPDDKLDGIWEPFFTTKKEEKGTGLGLSISRGIIEDHGGRITSENREEGGARFIVELPLKKQIRT